jgi:hypothetical protein
VEDLVDTNFDSTLGMPMDKKNSLKITFLSIKSPKYGTKKNKYLKLLYQVIELSYFIFIVPIFIFSTEHLTAIVPTSARTSATCSLASSRASSTSNPATTPFR